MTFRFSWMVLETLVENSIRILRECPHSIISRRSDGAGNVLTTMCPVMYNGRVYRGHYVTATATVLNVIERQLISPPKC